MHYENKRYSVSTGPNNHNKRTGTATIDVPLQTLTNEFLQSAGKGAVEIKDHQGSSNQNLMLSVLTFHNVIFLAA